ncbi:MAG TPA: DUF4382 domain-containing protein [Gemmatimonadaceae bacterium]
MKRLSIGLVSAATLATLLLGACSDDLTSVSGGNSGRLVVRLTDAPFLTDSVKSVDIFVVRVDGREADVSEDEAESNVESAGTSGWKTLASPGASINLMALQNGVSTTLGDVTLDAGSYSGFRLIIDQEKSSVTLKNGTVLNGGNSGIKFPSAGKSGIKIVLSSPVKIVGGATTNLLVDFDVNNSFVMRGNSIEKNGLIFKPVVKATITDAATVSATIRFSNATDAPLTLLQSNNPLTGATALAFGTSSVCSSVNATTPLLSVIQVGSTTPLTGFTPTLAVGTSYVLLAYPSGAATQFATLTNTFTATAGQGGLRVFNATGGATALDVFVTATGAPLGTATVANAANGVASAFVSVPAGSQQIRVTNTGSTTVLLDMGAQTLTAGQNATLVIAPPAAGSTTPRAFIIAGC